MAFAMSHRLRHRGLASAAPATLLLPLSTIPCCCCCVVATIIGVALPTLLRCRSRQPLPPSLAPPCHRRGLAVTPCHRCGLAWPLIPCCSHCRRLPAAAAAAASSPPSLMWPSPHCCTVVVGPSPPCCCIAAGWRSLAVITVTAGMAFAASCCHGLAWPSLPILTSPCCPAAAVDDACRCHCHCRMPDRELGMTNFIIVQGMLREAQVSPVAWAPPTPRAALLQTDAVVPCCCPMQRSPPHYGCFVILCPNKC